MTISRGRAVLRVRHLRRIMVLKCWAEKRCPTYKPGVQNASSQGLDNTLAEWISPTIE